ncbi:MAG: hypothetical protein O2820_21045 [Planctomycetota bacterium]|nr:hypothetical protein [Planctomycetota bacterium]MDA1251703.1 hypothetical protein [Planctomycetota bacterium]
MPQLQRDDFVFHQTDKAAQQAGVCLAAFPGRQRQQYQAGRLTIHGFKVDSLRGDADCSDKVVNIESSEMREGEASTDR